VRYAYIIALVMEAVGTSETSVYFNETTQCYIPEGCHLVVNSRELTDNFAGQIASGFGPDMAREPPVRTR
jgi:hypothetical protein